MTLGVYEERPCRLDSDSLNICFTLFLKGDYLDLVEVYNLTCCCVAVLVHRDEVHVASLHHEAAGQTILRVNHMCRCNRGNILC